jgi:protein-arginine kinase activator protein McsA
MCGEEVDDPRHACAACGEYKPNLVAHHVSYKENIRVPVCTTCHPKIHLTDRYPELTPELTRKEAEERGLLD